MVAHQLDIKEEFHPVTGRPKKGTTAGLDQLIAKKNEAKVFLYPVSAYSASSAEELYAETFSKLCLEGPTAVAPILRDAFYNRLPGFKRGSQTTRSPRPVA
jgi:hypothetical protein